MLRRLLTPRTGWIALHTALAVGPSFWFMRSIVLAGASDTPLWLVGVIAALGMAFVIAVLELFVQLTTNSVRRTHPIVLVLPSTLFAALPAIALAKRVEGFVPGNRYLLATWLCLAFAIALGVFLARGYVQRGEQ